MPNTTNLALPYPVASDAPNVPSHIQSLASAIDTYFGGAWTPFTITGVGSSGLTVGTGATQDNAWKRIGQRTAAFRIAFTFGTGGGVTGTLSMGPLPFTVASPSMQVVTGVMFKGASGTPTPVAATLSGTVVTRIYTPANAMVAAGVPWTWAAGDQIRIAGTCEITT